MNKVAMLTSGHPGFSIRIFHKQSVSLARAGYDVTFIAQYEKDEIIDGVKITHLPIPRNRFQRMVGLTLRVLLLALKERARIYHFHDPELIPVGLLLKLSGARVIYDVHEDYPASIRRSEWLPPLIRDIVASMFDVFERGMHYLFDHIIPATEHISTRFHRSKTTIVHNYPILQYFSDRTSVELPRRGRRIIYIGGLSEIRGVRETVQAMEYIDEGLQAELKLVGGFHNREFEEELRAMEVFSKVDFTGFIPYKEVQRHLCTADIGMVMYHPLPNHIEAMPVKMFEYMLMGLPVVASNFPLWKDIIEGNKCGLTADPMNPREIAEAIEYLLQRPQLMEEMGENGRQAVLEKYNWDREAEKLLSLYNDISH